jgi:hypothetical protein
MMADKYLFGTDVLGNIFESAINLYSKGAVNLPSFTEGESKRGASFDFPLNDADQAKKINEMFFPGRSVGRADGKYTAGTSDLNDIVSKSLNDKKALDGIQKQIKLQGDMNAANGFIPNFVSKSSLMGEGVFGKFYKLTFFFLNIQAYIFINCYYIFFKSATS